jgi:hypothetical protein
VRLGCWRIAGRLRMGRESADAALPDPRRC